MRFVRRRVEGLQWVIFLSLAGEIDVLSSACTDHMSWKRHLQRQAGNYSAVDSKGPTQVASNVPTSISTNIPTYQISDTPSVLLITSARSDQPSKYRSLYPSSLPTINRSMYPSLVPSDSPFKLPSTEPSDLPSSSPAIEASHSPTGVASVAPTESSRPSLKPTTVYSDFPSSFPSSVPSLHPTASPSSGPSNHPSGIYSQHPTTIPSQSPSAQPTAKCHDMVSYRNPINNHSCDQHNGTDCLQWIFLGMDVEEVVELVDSCPESCGIFCGTLQQYDIRFSFGVSNVMRFLDPSSVNILQNTSVEYLTHYVQAVDETTQYFMYKAELISQQMLPPDDLSTGGNRRHTLRRLQSNYVDLLVLMSFRSFTVGLDEGSVTDFLVEGVNSIGYTRALQRSGDPVLHDVDITTRIEQDTVPSQQEVKDGDHSASSAAVIVVSVLIGLGTGCVAFFIYVHRFRSSNRSGSDYKEGSQAGLISPVGSTRSPLANMFSLLSSRSNDDSSTSVDNSSDHFEETARQTVDEDLVNKLDVIPEILPEASMGETHESFDERPMVRNSSNRSEEEQHPLTGLIAPMIVFDNIESQRAGEETFEISKSKIKNIVPSVRVDATAEFVAALEKGSNLLEQAAYAHTYVADYPIAASTSDTDKEESLADESSTLAVTVVAPVADERLNDGAQNVESNEREKHPMGSPPKGRFSMIRKHYRFGSDASAAGVPETSSFALSEPSPTHESLQDGQGHERHPSNVTVKTGNGHQDLSEATTEGKQSIWTRSPTRRLRLTSSQAAEDNRGSLTTISTTGLASFMDQRVSANRFGRHSRNDSRGSNTSTDQPMSESEDGTRFIFQMPRRGKLGLVINYIHGSGFVVDQVKDYSPLLGQVEPGDKIISVDGISTEQMSPGDIQSFVSGGSTSRWVSGSTMRICFLSPRRKDDTSTDMFMDVGRQQRSHAHSLTVPSIGSSGGATGLRAMFSINRSSSFRSYLNNTLGPNIESIIDGDYATTIDDEIHPAKDRMEWFESGWQQNTPSTFQKADSHPVLTHQKTY